LDLEPDSLAKMLRIPNTGGHCITEPAFKDLFQIALLLCGTRQVLLRTQTRRKDLIVEIFFAGTIKSRHLTRTGFRLLLSSVGDPECLSRILIFTLPGFGSRISDPGSKNSNKREG
jgi:hypothetical protein